MRLLCSLRDAASDLEGLGARIVAVSVDDAHAVRDCATGNRIGYPLLLDREHRVADLYGVTDDGRAQRVSFVLDERGIVRHVDADIRVSDHGRDLVERIRALRR